MKKHKTNSNSPHRRPRPALSEVAVKAAPTVAPSTADNYFTALSSLQTFLGCPTVYATDITPERLHEYQRWLSIRGTSMNTISCYMRSLRSLLNKAGYKKAGSNFAHVFTGTQRTRKRAASIMEIQRLQLLRLPHGSRLCLVRDMFLFCIYAQGMPFVDMMSLCRGNIRQGAIVYNRHKTGQQVRVALTPELSHVIKTYAREDSDRLFPTLSLRYYNLLLKQLGQMAGIQTVLTSYVARHTWASIAYEMNVDLPVISQAMGHTDTMTTMTYIRQLNDERMEEANRLIMKAIKNPPLRKRWKR